MSSSKLGIGKQHNGGVEARVHPVMIPQDQLGPRWGGPFNGGADRRRRSRGSDALWTGSRDLPHRQAMVSDAINGPRASGGSGGVYPAPVVNDFSCGYYIRTLAADTPTSFTGSPGIFAKHGVSIESLCSEKGPRRKRCSLDLRYPQVSEKRTSSGSVAEIDQLDYFPSAV